MIRSVTKIKNEPLMSAMTEFKHDLNMEDSGNSCGSSVISEIFSDSECVQVSDLEGENESHILQVGKNFTFDVSGAEHKGWRVLDSPVMRAELTGSSFRWHSRNMELNTVKKNKRRNETIIVLQLLQSYQFSGCFF